MKDIPSIGTARGVFDIFVPGVFLLLHLIVTAACIANAVPAVRTAVQPLVDNVALSAAAFVCFGYLVGMLLRLLKTKWPDKLSGRFILFCLGKRWPEGHPFLRERFPYFAYLRYLAEKKLPPETLEFYKRAWLPRVEATGNRQFFNFCKVVVNAVDERSGVEAYRAEAITRYVSSMFYALVSSAVLVALLALIMPCACLWGVVILYVAAALLILHNLRFLRFKEVEALFTVTYYNDRIAKFSFEKTPKGEQSPGACIRKAADGLTENAQE